MTRLRGPPLLLLLLPVPCRSREALLLRPELLTLRGEPLLLGLELREPHALLPLGGQALLLGTLRHEALLLVTSRFGGDKLVLPAGGGEALRLQPLRHQALLLRTH